MCQKSVLTSFNCGNDATVGLFHGAVCLPVTGLEMMNVQTRGVCPHVHPDLGSNVKKLPNSRLIDGPWM